MDFQLLNGNKLKVTLSGDELDGYSLNCEKIDYNNTETRRAFWDIFNTAKYDTGFDAASEKVYIQVYPKKDNGCVIYVTKIGKKYTDSEAQLSIANEKNETVVYAFANMDILKSACRAVSTGIIPGGGSSVFCDGVMYYLAMDADTDENGYDYSALCEYGERIYTDGFYSYASEHCEKICDNAIEYFMKNIPEELHDKA